jgi:hypothetical protein
MALMKKMKRIMLRIVPAKINLIVILGILNPNIRKSLQKRTKRK